MSVRHCLPTNIVKAPAAPSSCRLRSRRIRRRRSVAAVLSGVAIFAVSQIALAFYFEIGAPEGHDPLYVGRLRSVQQALHQQPKPFTVVMLGTSRTLYGFRAGATASKWGDLAGRPVAAFNFGVPGAGPMTELLMWRRLQQDGVRPDLVLIEVMPVLLCGQKSYNDLRPEVCPTAQLRWRDLGLFEHYARTSRPGLRRDLLTAIALPCYGQRSRLTNLFAPELAPKKSILDDLVNNVDDFGAMKPRAAPTLEERRQLMQTARETYQPYFKGFRLGGQGCEALSELMASCRKGGVPAALVLMPEGPAFRSWYSPESLRDVQEWIGQLGRENNAPVIDAREWMAEDDFVDSHHLLPDGGARFTDRLGRETIAPLFMRQSGEAIVQAEVSPRPTSLPTFGGP
jgi:hypothetical protein